MLDGRLADRHHIPMFKPHRRRRRLALDHQQLGEALARKGGAQLERLAQLLEALRDVVERRLIAIGEALHQAGIAEEGLPAVW